MASLPYITSPRRIEDAPKAIQSAATPPNVSQDFVKTILKIPGGTGNQITSFLKKIGFANPDGSPSELYKRFRNPNTAGKAAAEALRIGYSPLYVRNEYMHQLSDEKLRGLIIEETGQGDESTVVGLVLTSIKAIKKFANWSDQSTPDHSVDKSPDLPALPPTNEPHGHAPPLSKRGRVGLNLGYTINLNLPATSDIAVFNAIFKSLKENLLRGEDE
jgi:hypothetical protein